MSNITYLTTQWMTLNAETDSQELGRLVAQVSMGKVGCSLQMQGAGKFLNKDGRVDGSFIESFPFCRSDFSRKFSAYASLGLLRHGVRMHDVSLKDAHATILALQLGYRIDDKFDYYHVDFLEPDGVYVVQRDNVEHYLTQVNPLNYWEL